VSVPAELGALAAQAVDLLDRHRRTVGTAESVTGGLIAAALTSVPGSSAVVRGGIVAYAAEVKTTLLGVPEDLLRRVGTVHPDVAAAMAEGARTRLGADIAVAVTGIAGPDPVDDQAVGTVHLALASSRAVRNLPLHLSGDRRQIRHEIVAHALRLIISTLREDKA
jgi:nicotinamide-nucleotide amidase